jgi:hypothetical protein
MIQLRILTGKLAGTEHTARIFPLRLGRAPSAGLRLEEDGVWDQHAELAFDPAVGMVLSAQPDALISVNGLSCREAVLRNGDEIALGALKLRFWLGPTRQAGFRVREWLTWAALAAITAGQLYLIYHLAP